MSMKNYSKYQSYCRFCSTKCEADTVMAVLKAVMIHEGEKHADRLRDEADRDANTRTGPVKMEDFYQ